MKEKVGTSPQPRMFQKVLPKHKRLRSDPRMSGLRVSWEWGFDLMSCCRDNKEVAHGHHVCAPAAQRTEKQRNEAYSKESHKPSLVAEHIAVSPRQGLC